MTDSNSRLNGALLILLVTSFALLLAACGSPAVTTAIKPTIIATTPVSPTEVPSPAPTYEPTAAPTLKPTETSETAAGFSDSLAAFLADPANGQSIADRGVELNSGQGHNACVFTVAEALRRIGCDIPSSTGYTPVLIKQLKQRGFSVSYQLSELQPGDICFTTNEQGQLDGVPTHTFVFLVWESKDVMRIFDNQSYDYGSSYHSRSIMLTYFNNQTDRPKEATAFFMHLYSEVRQ